MILITTSFTCFTFKKVCLGSPVLPLLFGAKIKTGGFALNTLKKLNGAKFGTPSLFMVLAKQIGRGATLEIKYWCNIGIETSEGMIVFICDLNYDPFLFFWYLSNSNYVGLVQLAKAHSQ